MLLYIHKQGRYKTSKVYKNYFIIIIIILDGCRVNANLTQKEVAGILKMSPATVNAHETGKISPKMEQIKKYAELYDVPVEIIDI